LPSAAPKSKCKNVQPCISSAHPEDCTSALHFPIKDMKYYTEDMNGCNNQFMLPVVAIVLITILNDGTIISIAYDTVLPSPKPEHWRLPEVFLVATILGGVAVSSSIILLDWGLGANEHNSIFKKLGLVDQSDTTGVSMSYAKVQTMMYLKISLSDFLTVFAARTRKPFFSRRPGNLLMLAACFAMGVSTLFSLYWPTFLPELQPLQGREAAVVWAYCLAWFILQDITKCGLYSVIECLTPSIMEMPCFRTDNSLELLGSRLDALETAVKNFQSANAQPTVRASPGGGHGLPPAGAAKNAKHSIN